VDREEFLRGYLNNFRGVREREFVKDYLQSMNPDDPDIFLPDNPKEYIPIRNKAFDQTLGSGFAEAYDKYKVLGAGAFGTTFQDPDDPNKVFKAQRLMMKDDINRAEKEVEAQLKAAEMGRAPKVHAVETFPARQDEMDQLRSLDTTGRFASPIIHVTEMDKVNTLRSQGYAAEPGGVIEKFVKNKMIEADDDAPIYKLINPEAQAVRNETRKYNLARAKGELDLADAGIIHADLQDSAGMDREEHITYNPNTNQMQFVDYGVARIHDHAGDMHRHTINQNLKNEEVKDLDASARAEHFLDHKASLIINGMNAVGNREEANVFEGIFNEYMGNDDLLAANDLVNQGRKIIDKHDFKDSKLKLQKGQKTDYIYGQLSNPTANQVVTDIQADKFPQFNNPNLYKSPSNPFPAPPYSNKEEERPLTDDERKDVQDLLRKLNQ